MCSDKYVIATTIFFMQLKKIKNKNKQAKEVN